MLSTQRNDAESDDTALWGDVVAFSDEPVPFSPQSAVEAMVSRGAALHVRVANRLSDPHASWLRGKEALAKVDSVLLFLRRQLMALAPLPSESEELKRDVQALGNEARRLHFIQLGLDKQRTEQEAIVRAEETKLARIRVKLQAAEAAAAAAMAAYALKARRLGGSLVTSDGRAEVPVSAEVHGAAPVTVHTASTLRPPTPPTMPPPAPPPSSGGRTPASVAPLTGSPHTPGVGPGHTARKSRLAAAASTASRKVIFAFSGEASGSPSASDDPPVAAARAEAEPADTETAAAAVAKPTTDKIRRTAPSAKTLRTRLIAHVNNRIKETGGKRPAVLATVREAIKADFGIVSIEYLQRILDGTKKHFQEAKLQYIDEYLARQETRLPKRVAGLLSTTTGAPKAIASPAAVVVEAGSVECGTGSDGKDASESSARSESNALQPDQSGDAQHRKGKGKRKRRESDSDSDARSGGAQPAVKKPRGGEQTGE